MLPIEQVAIGEITPPPIPDNVYNYLSTIFSSTYQLHIRTHQQLITHGASEAYAFGFIAGLNEAKVIMDSLRMREQDE